MEAGIQKGFLMKRKKVCLIINPRAGQNLAKITGVLAVLSAAGWSIDITLKEYGGQTMDLATSAAKDGCDIVVAYGGDGTLNQVVNGVMNAKGQHSTVGVIPGGTANVWAGEIGVPDDPVKAVLALYNSEARKVDIGHVEVEGLTLPGTTQDDQQHNGSKPNKKKTKASPMARHHFLLMAGLGIDAAIMEHVSKPMKYRLGPLAVGVSAAKELPEQHPFPVEIRAASLQNGDVLWQGEAIQVVIGNTRRYAGVLKMTPDAYIDDGILDVCVITAGDPLTTMQQITSLLLQRKPDSTTAEYFHGAHLSISVPASIAMQLDGSAVKLKDYLSKSDRAALEHAGDPGQVMVTYRFDAMPRALRVAIPCTYDEALFEESTHHEEESAQAEHQDTAAVQAEPAQEAQGDHVPQHTATESDQSRRKALEHVKELLEHGRKVTVVGVSPNPDKKDMYIVAGSTIKQRTGESRPVAVRVENGAAMMKQTGENLPPAALPKLQEGETIIVKGKKNKRGVIRPKAIVI
jgi:YegS/Rv2252/BmrU family lipid kinase